ncbi:MAG: DEAD/DEAH box helicase [Planctomycetes bacterium]|nr:DEAD/DEAH box helicase [Planctomycetota bacterium]
MSHDFPNPAIVQPDLTILLEVDNPRYVEARDAFASFAELVKSPEHMHTYRISPLSLWNAAAAGISVSEVKAILEDFSRYAVPANVLRDVEDYMGRYGRLRLERAPEGDGLVLIADDPLLQTELLNHKAIGEHLGTPLSPTMVEVPKAKRGLIKQALIKIGYPAQDVAGYTRGAALEISVLPETKSGKSNNLRDYQVDAANTFYASGGSLGGSGAIVLPCGAGKTIVGIATMAQVKAHTLILAPNIVSVHQWRRELLERTNLTEDQIGEYSGESKEIKPITIATYQIITWRPKKGGDFPHFQLLNNPNWGLIIYDEVHLLPAPVFRATAELQARRRLGLTATLVREDGLESDVFSLIGPKKFEVPWKVLEGQGWIAPATCGEVRVPLPPDLRMKYAMANDREKFRMSSENPEKERIIRRLLEVHDDEPVLIIGQYIEQLEKLAKNFDIPLIIGRTSNKKREELYAKFRTGELKQLIVSRVGNFAVDLPDASVLIQVSGTFGSRQEEAQRLGRVLRPKEDGRQAHFYSLVSADSKDQDFAANRQLFLVEQGYRYDIYSAAEVLDPDFRPAEEVCAAS